MPTADKQASEVQRPRREEARTGGAVGAKKGQSSTFYQLTCSRGQILIVQIDYTGISARDRNLTLDLSHRRGYVALYAYVYAMGRRPIDLKLNSKPGAPCERLNHGCNAEALDPIGQGKGRPEPIENRTTARYVCEHALHLRAATVVKDSREPLTGKVGQSCMQLRMCMSTTRRQVLQHVVSSCRVLSILRLGALTVAQVFVTVRRRFSTAVLCGLLFACERGGHIHCLWCVVER